MSMIIIVLCAVVLFKTWAGSKNSSRITGIYLIGILLLALAGLTAYKYNNGHMIDAAIAWAILEFVIIIALSKHAEGKNLDD